MHFNGVKIPTLPHRKNIDIFIGQSDKALLTVLEERESLNFDEPNLVLTRLGLWLAVAAWMPVLLQFRTGEWKSWRATAMSTTGVN